MGTYGRERELVDRIKADSGHLANAPLGPIQKKRLERTIAAMREELKELRRLRRLRREENRNNTNPDSHSG